MNTKALRQKVLDLAIHGKLVPQNSNDESATVLLEKIREEKAEKIKKGELKADKKDSFIFVGSDKRHYEQFADGSVKDIEDAIPFLVPEGWAWCRLTNVAITELGKTLDAKKNKGESYDYLCALNVKWYTFDFTSLKQIRLEEKEKERYLVRKGDLLICEGGDVGRSAIWESDNPIYYQNALHRVRFYQSINQYFFLYILNHYKNLGLIDDVSGGVTIKHFTQNSMQKLIFPLPPLAEQERIVSVIKSIFSQIDTLDQNKSDLQISIKQTKSKILDLAIHGKLVPQDPSDEPAEELLKRIATSDNRPYEKLEDEIDYEIPKNWCLCKIKDVCSVIMGQSPEGEAVSDDKNGMEFHQGKICFGKKYLEESSSFTKHITKIAPKDSVLLCVRAPVGIVNITEREICIGRGLCAVIPKYEINSDFWFYWLQSLQSDFEQKATGTTFRAISVDVIKNQIVTIPPHEEQNRIVNKINELYEQLDKIVLNLV